MKEKKKERERERKKRRERYKDSLRNVIGLDNKDKGF